MKVTIKYKGANISFKPTGEEGDYTTHDQALAEILTYAIAATPCISPGVLLARILNNMAEFGELESEIVRNDNSPCGKALENLMDAAERYADEVDKRHAALIAAVNSDED